MNSFSFDQNNFIVTKEHRRFEEFADACEQYRYIGLCYGKPGVGKTCSARYYAKWEAVEKYYSSESLNKEEKQKVLGTKALLYTAPITNTPKRIQERLYRELFQFGNVFAKAQGKTDLKDTLLNVDKQCPLVIIDEADSLTYQSLEQLRHMYDEYGFGLILIGMPGMEKRLSRYPQLYSRIGFAHEYHCLNYDEMEFIFEQHWKHLDLILDKNQFSDVEASKTIIRITNGNFRLIQRIFSQITRLQKINNLTQISKELVEAARDCLVIG